MNIEAFQLERYFAKHEFQAPYLLSCTDCEPLSLNDLLGMADESSLQMWENLSLGYTETQGHPVLREEISDLYSNIGTDDVLVLVPEEGIFVVMNCLLTQQDHVITTFPGFQSLYEIARSLGCEVTRWTPRRGNEGWIFDVSDLKKALRENTKLIVMNFPHNPTGANLQEGQLREIIDLADRREITLFSDEMYRFLEYDEKDRLPSASDLSKNAISLCGMSKSFGLAGLRIGWLTTRNPELLKEFITFKDYTTICNSAPSELLAIIALRSKERILSRNLKIIRNNLETLDNFFQRYEEMFSWHKPRAGSIAFPELTADRDISELCSDLVEKKGVMLVPSQLFDHQGNYFRVGFGRADMEEALEKFDEYLKENPLFQ